MFKTLFFISASFLLSGQAMAIEEPKYQVIEKSGPFELRAYDSMIIAETLVEGSMDDATSKGFRRIAGYIFGGNTSNVGSNVGEKQKISMTAPVTIEPKAEKISMTAPVTLKEQEGSWNVHFVMPSEYTMQALPKPNSSKVTLREIPPQNFAVISFSGFAGTDKVASKTKQLNNWLSDRNISPKGKPQLARYNPPWTLPFMRRNEVMVLY
jgi:hypothetical protein